MDEQKRSTKKPTLSAIGLANSFNEPAETKNEMTRRFSTARHEEPCQPSRTWARSKSVVLYGADELGSRHQLDSAFNFAKASSSIKS